MNARIERLRQRFKEFGISGFLVQAKEWIPADHLRYLVGFKGEGFLLVKADTSYFVTDSRYEEDAARQLKDVEVIIITKEDGKLAPMYPLYGAMRRRMILEPGEKVGIEGERLPANDYLKLQEFFPQNEFHPIIELVDNISEIKDEDEIATIRKAVAITEHIFVRHILPKIRPGIKEIYLAQEISIQGLKHGAEKDGWSPIVASGPNSSMPHYEAGERVFEAGDILQFDFGYFFDGYCSDFSRVVIVGQEPSEEQKEVHRIVLNAQIKAIEAIRPGIKRNEVHNVAVNVIKQSKYSEFCFKHSLGHGIGIKVHSEPRFGPTENEELYPGHVFTVEPAIYIPGWGGMRIEDVVVVTKDGCENFNSASKEIKVVR